MWRFSIIQELIYKVSAITYLEVGVSDARIIKKINAKYKFGVDPYFSFSKWDRIKFYFKSLNFIAYETTSDNFFKNLPNKLKNKGVDVAFIDGLHTYKQTLRDIENTLLLLNDNGYIVVHDCSPTSFAAAYPVKESINEVHELAEKNLLEGWEGNWNGDTWKALVHIRITHRELKVMTVDTDFGVGVITRGEGKPFNGLSIDELEKSDYYFLENNRVELLNLISIEKFQEYLDLIGTRGVPYLYLSKRLKFRIFLSKIKKKILFR
jgi:hypothetical protein